MSDAAPDDAKAPPFRYAARLANEIEARWQDYWDEHRTFWTPNPTGPLADGFEAIRGRERLYVLDMFPYPSGAGLHVGHPLGYIGTDVFARFHRMNGRNVLHAFGYDAFGLPAEQYALETRQHPRAATEANIATMRRQLRTLGLAHDPRRSLSTTDVGYYRWTQWIFLQIFGSWYDEEADRARPIAELVAELEAGSREPAAAEANPDGLPWAELDARSRRAVVDSYRLAYLDEAPVNWCPGLGTVLANEEVTAEGRSERGNFPVFKRPLKQWKLAITKYADRLLHDLDLLDWPEPIKTMQRNWIGRSTGATIRFPVEEHEGLDIEVFTTRPDTLFGATYMVLAPEHPLVEQIVPSEWPLELPDLLARHVRARRAPDRSGAALPRVRCAQDRPRATGRRAREDRRVHRRLRAQPGERLEHPDLHRRLRPDGLRHRGDHGGARARTSATGSSPRSSTCRSSVPCSRRTASKAQPTSVTAPRSRAASSTVCASSEAKERIAQWLEETGVGGARR